MTEPTRRLTHGQVQLILTLGKTPVDIKRLAEYLNVSRSTVQQVIDEHQRKRAA